MRYLKLALSALWLVARALAYAARRRGARVRRYAAEPPRPHVVTGPIPIVLPSARTGTAVAPPLPPPLPPGRPRIGAPAAPIVHLDPYRRRARDVASRRGLVVLMAVARQAEEDQEVRAA